MSFLYGFAILAGSFISFGIRRRTNGIGKKNVELDQEAINRSKIALNSKTEKDAIKTVLRQFDADIRLAEITYKNAGAFDYEAVFEDRLTTLE